MRAHGLYPYKNEDEVRVAEKVKGRKSFPRNRHPRLDTKKKVMKMVLRLTQEEKRLNNIIQGQKYRELKNQMTLNPKYQHASNCFCAQEILFVPFYFHL